MLFKDGQLEGIRRGTTTRTYRRWSSARVRRGGVYRLRRDLAVRVTAVRPWNLPLTRGDARAAGFADLGALMRALASSRSAATLYRVDFVRCEAPDDPRERLARSTLSNEVFEGLRARLDAMDRRSRDGAWTGRVLEAIAARPGVRAADLAAPFGWNTPDFKARVRRLKGIGLTESLDTGYRLSRLGKRYLVKRRRGSAP